MFSSVEVDFLLPHTLLSHFFMVLLVVLQVALHDLSLLLHALLVVRPQHLDQWLHRELTRLLLRLRRQSSSLALSCILFSLLILGRQRLLPVQQLFSLRLLLFLTVDHLTKEIGLVLCLRRNTSGYQHNRTHNNSEQEDDDLVQSKVLRVTHSQLKDAPKVQNVGGVKDTEGPNDFKVILGIIFIKVLIITSVYLVVAV